MSGIPSGSADFTSSWSSCPVVVIQLAIEMEFPVSQQQLTQHGSACGKLVLSVFQPISSPTLVYINAGDVKVIGLTDDDQNADAMNVMIPSWLL